MKPAAYYTFLTTNYSMEAGKTLPYLLEFIANPELLTLQRPYTQGKIKPLHSKKPGGKGGCVQINLRTCAVITGETFKT